jgi:DNA-binding NtrC family response regulator
MIEIMSTILFIEDDPLSALCLVRLLEDSGHQVQHALDTDKALELINENNHEVLISDWAVDGTVSTADIAKLVKQKNSAAKIFFTTGYSKDVIQSALPGFDSYSIFQKPIDFDKLLKEIQ